MIGHNVLNEWTHADVMTVNMLGMSHPEFCSMFERFKTPKDFAEWDQVADYGRNDANTSYSGVALYTLQFLNAYLKRNRPARTAVTVAAYVRLASVHLRINFHRIDSERSMSQRGSNVRCPLQNRPPKHALQRVADDAGAIAWWLRKDRHPIPDAGRCTAAESHLRCGFKGAAATGCARRIEMVPSLKLPVAISRRPSPLKSAATQFQGTLPWKTAMEAGEFRRHYPEKCQRQARPCPRLHRACHRGLKSPKSILIPSAVVA